MPIKIPERDWTVHTSELIWLLDMDSKQLTLYNRLGMPGKVSRGLYNLPDVLRWILANSVAGSTELATVEEARKALLEQQARKAFLEAEALEGKVLPIEEVDALIQELLTTLMGGLDALPARAAPTCAHREPDDIQRELDNECRTIAADLARAVRSLGEDLQASESARASPEPTRGTVGGSAPATATG